MPVSFLFLPLLRGLSLFNRNLYRRAVVSFFSSSFNGRYISFAFCLLAIIHHLALERARLDDSLNLWMMRLRLYYLDIRIRSKEMLAFFLFNSIIGVFLCRQSKNILVRVPSDHNAQSWSIFGSFCGLRLFYSDNALKKKIYIGKFCRK